jgi:hypothetical protein
VKAERLRVLKKRQNAMEYARNVARYPKFQEYFRSRRLRLLAMWGKNDPFFVRAGGAYDAKFPMPSFNSWTPGILR